MAKTPLALVSADWHVRKADRVWYRRDEIYGDTGYALSQIGDIAGTHNTPAVILAGDIFDLKLQQSDALRTMRLILDRFEQQSREVYFVEGQHERSTPPLLSAMHTWPKHLHKHTEVLGGLRFYGLDYCNPSDVEAELKAVPDDTDVLVTHQVWKNFLGDKHGDAWFRWVNGTRLIISGDYHRAVYAQHEGKQVLSPGSINMQDIGEVPNKYVYILYDDLSVLPVTLKSRLYFEANVSTEEELENLISTWADNPARTPQPGVPTNIATNLVRIRYRGDLPQARQRLEAALVGVHLFIDAVRPPVAEQITMEQQRRVHAVMAGGLEGCIAEFYADDTRVRDNAIRLARTTNIQTELLSIYKDLLSDGNDGNREGTFSATP